MAGVMVEAEVVHSDSNKQLIDTLRRSKLFRRYEQVFSEATGLPLTLRPVDYWQLDITAKSTRIGSARCLPNAQRHWRFVYKRIRT